VKRANPSNEHIATAASFALGEHIATFAPPTVLKLIAAARPTTLPVEGGKQQDYSLSVADIAMRGTAASQPDTRHSAGNRPNRYAEALAVVVDNQNASVSLIQRKLQCGFNEAAGYIELMEAAGIVSAPEASSEAHYPPYKRRVLVEPNSAGGQG
jgi:DNA segregation ATPase FtsK/SpoIIIE-like protein